MDGFSLKILELNWEERMLGIGIRVKAPYDPSVREPKIAIIFENGKETRRIPLIVQAYFPEENLEKCVVFAKYGYNLEYLFFETPENKRISFYFEVTYGDKILDHMPFVISSDVKLDEDEDYKISISNEDTIVLEKVKEVEAVKKISVLQGLFQSVVGEIWGFGLIFLAIFLVPIFWPRGFWPFLAAPSLRQRIRRPGSCGLPITSVGGSTILPGRILA